MRLLSSTLFFVLLFLTACIATAQKNNNLSSAYSITYKSTSYLYGKDKSPVKEYMRLMANDKISSFQAYNDMELDSLRKNGTMSQDSRNRFYANEKSTIEIRGNIVSYYEDILDNEYWYKETLNFKWNLLSDVKTINGYSCKKAKVNYGGRVWTAWYTTSIPLSTGPYKFKGLPGLIIKIYDEDSVFDYELTTIIEKPVIAVGKYFHSKPFNERIEMSHDEFNKFKKSYNALSLNEKLVLLNNQQEGKIKGVSISAAGTVNEEIGNRRSVIQPDMIEIIGDK